MTERVELDGVLLALCNERRPIRGCPHCPCFHWWIYGEDGGGCCACGDERTEEEKETWKRINP